MSDTESLTKYLTSYAGLYTEAVYNNFLVQAGVGAVEHDVLGLSLSQYRIFIGHAYPTFVGSLISRIPFDSKNTVDSNIDQHHKHILRILLSCLERGIRNDDYLVKTAGGSGFNLDQMETKGTRDHSAEMARVSHNDLYEGLVFLWAIEKIYLDAWTFVRDMSNPSMTKSGSHIPTTYVQPVVRDLSETWTTLECIQSVDSLANVVDSLRIKPGSKEWGRAEEIWTRVVELQVGFWPSDVEI
ncbi:heme oxygenase-like protein [Lentinula raphanica]|nr:heme oxygenase-like protein [Lentinula raphanica]KAJ3964013.1 heme oxygenase-like protein [Lentinula raphanica]